MNPFITASKPLKFISPQVADHFAYFWQEIYVAVVDSINRVKFRQSPEDNNLKINFGCGNTLKEGFLNINFAPAADLRIDLRKKLPLRDCSCEFVFSEHFIEHLAYPEGVESFLDECFRVLKPDGELFVSVPGTEWILQEYANGSRAYLDRCAKHKWHPEECETFMEHINFHFHQRWRGKSYNHFGIHRFSYDFETMEKKMSEAGFSSIELRDFDPDLDSEHRRVGSLFAKAKRLE